MFDENMFPEVGYFVHRRCTSAWRIGEAVIHFYDLTYLTSGSAFYTINGNRIHVNSGDLLCIPPGSTREAVPDTKDPMHCFAVNFQLYSNGPRTRISHLPFQLVTKIGDNAELVNLFQEMNFAWLAKGPVYKSKAGAILLIILHEIYEQILCGGHIRDARIRHICRHITTHFTEKLTVKDLASIVGMNHVYFGNLFKREMNMSVHQYIAKTRVNAGKNLLSSGEYTVSEAAASCGFSDNFYFYRQFKRILGCSPSSCIPRGEAAEPVQKLH